MLRLVCFYIHSWGLSKFDETVERVWLLLLLPWIFPGWLWWWPALPWLLIVTTKGVAIPSSHVVVGAHAEVDSWGLSEGEAACRGLVIVAAEVWEIYQAAGKDVAWSILACWLERSKWATWWILLLWSSTKTSRWLEARLDILLLVWVRRNLCLLETS